MDPNPKNFPILSYVMTNLPTIKSFRQQQQPTSPSFDIENPAISTTSSSMDPTFHDTLISRLPHLKDPDVITLMTSTVSEIAQTRSVLQALGDRPDHESIDLARSKLAEIDSLLASQLDEIDLGKNDEKDSEEKIEREKLERDKSLFKAIVQVDEMHDAYEKLLREAEEKLVRIYDTAAAKAEGSEVVVEEEEVEVCEEVVRVLKEEGDIERVDLSGKKLRILPEDFGRLKRVVVLNLSTNQLQVLFL